MNAISDKARAAALQFECKKHGLSQQQSGEWTLALKVHPDQAPSPVLTAPMGTRYQAVLVEIDDNEMPVEQPQPDKKEDKHRLSKTAAWYCRFARFQAFLRIEHGADIPDYGGTDTTEQREAAAQCVRKICGVQSRSEFDSDSQAATRWRDLKSEYEGWKIT